MSDQPTFDSLPSIDDIAELAEQALAKVPKKLRVHLDGAIMVEDRADDETLRKLGIVFVLEFAWPLSRRVFASPRRRHGHPLSGSDISVSKANPAEVEENGCGLIQHCPKRADPRDCAPFRFQR
jgi:hypothetical protein